MPRVERRCNSDAGAPRDALVTIARTLSAFEPSQVS
jgi:hypothetical protein